MARSKPRSMVYLGWVALEISIEKSRTTSVGLAIIIETKFYRGFVVLHPEDFNFESFCFMLLKLL